MRFAKGVSVRATFVRTLVALTFSISTAEISAFDAAIPKLEPQRISHYDPNAIPDGVRTDLPPIIDAHGKRDAFFYPDGLLKGRVVHMRFPKNYVHFTQNLPPRHATQFSFAVIYPRMISIIDPEVIESMKRNGGHILDDEVHFSIQSPGTSSENEVAGLKERMRRYEKKKDEVHFSEIKVPSEFAAGAPEKYRASGIREVDVRGMANGDDRVIDTYMLWSRDGKINRFMRCYPSDARPQCNMSIDADKASDLYGMSFSFHMKLLSRLPSLTADLRSLIGSFMVKVY
ncbi:MULTISPECIES: hypothetical protein [Burkholderia cepacia complex]|nr:MULTISPECIES: hypothetical protein [Burkholderia cepacia complex]